MSARKKIAIISIIGISSLPFFYTAKAAYTAAPEQSLARDSLAQQLGWVVNKKSFCGGYYLEEPFVYPTNPTDAGSVEITGKSGIISLRSKSTLEGKVSITRHGQQITANSAYLYRDPNTYKLSAVEMTGNVNLREPNTLIVAKQGRYDFQTDEKSLKDILYRTTLSGKRQLAGPKVPEDEIEKKRKIDSLTAWGTAYEFSQNEPRIYVLNSASFSTCSPENPAWQVKASKIVLNKNTGRGYALNARILAKSIPIFYMPYFNFSIDNQRKSGFLWPTVGIKNIWGEYIQAPFYWNMAPNYDMTITPGYLSKRGTQVGDKFRYLSSTNYGQINFTILPGDRYFSGFQTSAANNPEYTNPVSTNIQSASVTQAEYNRLQSTSTTRKSLTWHDDGRYNDHWSSHIDFSYAGDDYYLRDFGKLNEATQNQILQVGNLYYKGPNWNFTGTIQSYQTLHPINQTPVLNQYRRFPQLILNADYPDQPLGMEYLLYSEVAHFEILKTPGTTTVYPVGNRTHLQPGISLPLYTPSTYINPRLQLAMTDYNLYQVQDTNTPGSKKRVLPIFDVASGFTLDRSLSIFGHAYEQTLEPQLYYTYIPYRNQASIPNFDTTVNTLTYDQLFNYNRFTGIDRIGDANQVGVGVTTRFLDEKSGTEKMRLGVGDIIYFANRRVTYCNDPQSCTDNPYNNNNHRRISPLSGTLSYNVSNHWTFGTDLIWNTITRQVDNTNIGFHYQPDDQRVFNIGYSYVFNGDIESGINTNNTADNLKISDISFSWPMTTTVSAVGRWSQDWNANHFQNLLYGIQYDTCCWAMRLVGGRSFTNLTSTTAAPQYNSEFYIQFALKGLGDVGTGNSGLLSSITGYNTQLGR